MYSPASARHSLHRSPRPARSTRRPSGGWPGARSMPASTSWCRAARRARRPRSPATSGAASSKSASRRPPAARLVLAGAGGYDTREVIHAAAEMKKAGAHGLLSVTPYYNKPTPEGLYQHYKAIADSTPLPIIVYNVPGRTGCNVDPATLVRLAAISEHRRRQGSVRQRHADGGDLPQRAGGLRGAVRRRRADAAADGDRRAGNHLGGVQRGAGGDGAAGRGRRAGDFAGARHWHEKLLPLMQVNFVESSPGPVKFAMAAMGLCEDAVPPADGAAAAGVAGEDPGGAEGPGAAHRVGSVAYESGGDDCALCSRRAPRPTRPRRATRSSRLQRLLNAGEVRAAEPDPADAVRLARQHVGQAGHPARLPLWRHSWTCRPITAAGPSTTRTRCR